MAVIGHRNHQRLDPSVCFHVFLHPREIISLHIVVELRFCAESFRGSRRCLPTKRTSAASPSPCFHPCHLPKCGDLLRRAVRGKPLVVNACQLLPIERRGWTVANVERIFVVDFNQGDCGIMRVFKSGVGVAMSQQLLWAYSFCNSIMRLSKGTFLSHPRAAGTRVLYAVARLEWPADQQVKVDVNSAFLQFRNEKVLAIELVRIQTARVLASSR